jgi:hypothetical protein
MTTSEQISQDASLASVATGEALRAGEVALAVFVGLLVCPPLAILVVVVAVPLLLTGLVLGLLAAVLSTPYLLVHHFRNPDRGHASLLAHRVRVAGRAVFDLAPHRIVAEARKVASAR